MAVLKGFFYTSIVAMTTFVALPCALFYATGGYPLFDLNAWRFAGFMFFAPGLLLFYLPVLEFGMKGRGTPAPFDASHRLVTDGIYGYIRNPMHLGAFFVLLGEGIIFTSKTLILLSLGVLPLFQVI